MHTSLSRYARRLVIIAVSASVCISAARSGHAVCVHQLCLCAVDFRLCHAAKVRSTRWGVAN